MGNTGKVENTAFRDFITQHRQKFSNTPRIPAVLCPTIQHSALDVHGGLGDFVLQSASLFPSIEWVLPLTSKIKYALKEQLQGSVGTLPIELYDPISGEPFIFDMDFYYHINPENHSLSWLVYNKDLLEPLPDLEFRDQNIYAGLGNFKGVDDLLTLENAPLLKEVHPLLRRYTGDESYIDMISQCAIAKAVAKFLSIYHDLYQVTWVHDWHFSSLAGELLLTGNKQLVDKVIYIQYIHNALYQGDRNNPELVEIMGWPKHFFTADFFRIHGKINLLGGALNILKNHHLHGKAATVSEQHALELTTVEHGAGLHPIFRSLQSKGRLTGVNNPIEIPPDILIKTPADLENKKLALKKALQEYFGLPLDENALTLLWSHRFTQQKQVKAMLMAIKKILSSTDLNIQFMFFSDIHIGSDPKDIDTLEKLIKRYPRQIAQQPFAHKMEMKMAGGADCSIMASFFEPFGYAPVWVAMQGGIVITARNGGQMNIFKEDQAIWLDILPDVSNAFKRYSLQWWKTPSLWFISNKGYQRRVIQKNADEIYRGVIQAERIYREDRARWNALAINVRQRIMQLAGSDKFSSDIIALLNYQESGHVANLKQTEQGGLAPVVNEA
jgi:glycogen synthase